MKKIVKYLSLFLMLCIIFTSSAFSVSSSTEKTAVQNLPEVSDSASATETRTDETSSTDTLSVLTLSSVSKDDCMISEYVSAKAFDESKHVKRLPAEETLDTYVFQNEDGTKSVYYMYENVKFVDDDGKVKEKDVSLVRKDNGYGIVRNNVDLYIPDAPRNGIDVSYGGYDVKITPVSSVLLNSSGRKENETVVYDGFFGAKTKLKYTPTLSGIKEDVVLEEYIPNASFDFILDTDGLYIYTNDDGSYLAPNAASKKVFDLGKVIVYDAVGRPTTGTMTIEPVAEGKQYRITVSAPEEFLTDPLTSYPVTIDPTVTVSDSVTGGGAIEDAVIFAGLPNHNGGDYVYLSIGYIDTTYTVGRVAVKLPGLYNSSLYNNLSDMDITSVKFYCWDTSGNEKCFVDLHPITGPAWTESTATWSQSYTCDTTLNSGAYMVNAEWASFDITSLVRAWKTGDYSAELGFMLSNGEGPIVSKKKAPYSSEVGGSTYKPYVVMTYSSNSAATDDFADAVTLTLNQSVAIDINISGEKEYFKFTPSTEGFFTFKSFSNTGDPYVSFYNNSQEQISFDDDGGGSSNFRLTYHFSVGRTYYFAVGCYGSGTGNYSVHLIPTTNPSYINSSSVNWGSSKSVTCNIKYSASFYRFTPPTTGKYLFYTSNANGDPKIWVYDESMNRIALADDGAGNYNSRLVATLTAGETYYVVAGHYGANCGSYTLKHLLFANFENDVHLLKNVGSNRYMEIHGPGAQEWIHQSLFHTGAYERWKFQPQSDGSYIIRSEYGAMKYVGVENGTTGIDNVKLYSEVTNNTKWNIYINPSGDLFLEPVGQLGKILYAPNVSSDTELQLEWLSYSGSERHKWRFEVISNVPLEGQRMSNWCWAASIRMLTKHYFPVPDARTQNLAVSAVKGSELNEGGNTTEAIRAAGFYYSNNINTNELNLVSKSNVRMSECTLQQFLNDGHVVYICRGRYKNNEREGSHATVVVGYTMIVVDGMPLYQYIIYDPAPLQQPRPWETPQITEGEIIKCSYQWICNGRNITSIDTLDTSIWEGFIVVQTDYSNNTLSPVYN